MSNYIKATNFTAKDALPSGNSGKIVKGTEVDVELTAIASAIASKADTAGPTFTGSPAAPTANAGTNTTQIATTAFVTTAIASAFPSGGIILWSGSIATIPTGWVLCNGSNSTPDLRDRFIVGAGNSYAVAATGGSANAITVAHTHTATSTVIDPGHAHTYLKNVQPQYTGTGVYTTDVWDNQSATTSTASTGISVSTTVASAGSSGTNANLPPYYALCYIMKT
jgi:microcystin-dependent protein